MSLTVVERPYPFHLKVRHAVNIQCGQSDAAAMLGEAIGLVMMENVAVPPASEMEVLVKYEV